LRELLSFTVTILPMDMFTSVTTSFDAQLDAVENIRWHPWVGRSFGAVPHSRLLIVGESHYARPTGAETMESLVAKLEANPDFTREVIWDCPIEGDWGNRTLERIEPIFSNSGKSTGTVFWERVAFYNLVQRIMRFEGTSERPTWDDLVAGWRTFAGVAEVLRPDLCVFLGSGCRHSFVTAFAQSTIPQVPPQAFAQIGRCWAYRTEFHLRDSAFPLVLIQHPSRYFSPSKWHELLRPAYPAQLSTFAGATG
jgi:hypothetical protein